uniref:TonB_dep_Rec domain-containing protein n=1 Tax=Rhabditophanes sp. KR3021 TaxID=114890 RepID=A0AC35UC69_9BILA
MCQYRNRPRGLGLLSMPTGVADERTGPFVPGLYIAGDKASHNRPQPVPAVHLGGQRAEFSGKSSFNPFTQAVGAVYNEDLTDSWSAGYAVQGVNNYGLNVRKNFDQYADVNLDKSDGGYQPFVNSFMIGAEFDLKKIKEFGINADLPIVGVNELFDFDFRQFLKGNGNGVFQNNFDFPLTLSDPSERFPFHMKYLNYMADRVLNYGHVVPTANLFLVDRDKIMDRLMSNKANPSLIG